MLLYPGGTARDHHTVGYSITGNFLSDLGMTVAYNGTSNRVGAALFVSSIVLLIVGMGGALAGFVRLYGSSQRARRFALSAGVLGLIDCACFAGVALAPEDRAMSMHVAFTLAAFRILPFAALLITLAAHATPGTPRAVVGVWALLTIVLLAYVVMLQGGAWARSPAGFASQVLAQKVVAVVMVSALVWQSVAAAKFNQPPRAVRLRT